MILVIDRGKGGFAWIKQQLKLFLVILMVVIPFQVAVGTSTCQISGDSKMELKTADYVDVIDMINQVNESLLSYYLEDLVEIGPWFVGSENCSEAALYLYYEFRKLGLDVQIEPWKFPRCSCQNVVATLKGTDRSSDAVVVVCAHYDTISHPKPYGISPGALDDVTLAPARPCTLCYAPIHSYRNRNQ